MTEKTLQTDDKLLFVRYLYDYFARPAKDRIVTQASAKIGIAERSFRNKMLSSRPLKGQEVDIIENVCLVELGQDAFDKQLRLFIEKMSDGDLRTIDKSQNKAISELTEQNQEMATSHIFNLT